MANLEIDTYNAEYFGIPVSLMPRHNELMGMPMGQWPPDLLAEVKAQCIKYGMCGDVIASAVANWIKSQTPSEG